MTKKTLVLVGALGLVAVVAVARFALLSGESLEDATIFEAQVVCLACHEESTIAYGRDERAPFVCPNCHERACYMWMYCSHCDARLIPFLTPAPDGSSPAQPSIALCPKCNHSVGQWVQIDEDEEVDTLPLPAWPVK